MSVVLLITLLGACEGSCFKLMFVILGIYLKFVFVREVSGTFVRDRSATFVFSGSTCVRFNISGRGSIL